jgi:lipopolysaccharide transport system permease protein
MDALPDGRQDSWPRERIPDMVRYFAEIWSCRYFWLSLAKIDLKTRYRRSWLGVGWSLVRPLLLTIILCVFLGRLFRRTDVLSFAPYLLSGLCCWDYIVIATKQGCNCFLTGETYLRQHPTPLAVFPLRVALVESFHFFMGLVVLLILVSYAKGFPNPLVLVVGLVPTFVMLFVLIWSLGTLAGLANVYFQDTQHLCDVVFQIIFYMTPVVYHASDLGPGRLSWMVSHCNPLVPLLEVFREPILESRIPAAWIYFKASLVVVCVAALAWRACRRAQHRLIFYL